MIPDLEALLEQHFGFTEFRPGQRQVIEEILGQGRALAVFPTGAGKSLCYQLPALALDGVTIVISPLIALMKDQIDFLQGRGIAAARLDSSLEASQARAISDDLRAGQLKLLYVAPERFNNERFLAQLQQIPIALFAVDEAHCISEWGHNFRPDYLKLAEIARDLQVPRILALTATATPEVATAICESFQIPPLASVNTGFYRPNLKLCLTPAPDAKRAPALLKRLQTRAPGSSIVYVTLQKTAEQLAEFLSDNGLAARAYHAGMEADTRHEVQEWWMQSDSHIVVATIAFGMGIDKSDVRYVYHFNLPKGLESYSQEIGRAGRDGKPSVVELFACPDDVPVLENFVFGDTPTPASLQSLVAAVLGSGDEFAVSIYEWSNRHDLRQLVLKTCLTYLELMGVLKQGTPFYAGYEVRLHDSLPMTLASFTPKARDFLTKLFRTARQGKIWWKIDSEAASQQLEVGREHIVKAMGLLEERGLAEVKAADARNRYQLLQPDADAEELVAELADRFIRRETNEVRRVNDVLNLVTHDGCQTNALVGYFGEARTQPCGHCTFCVTSKATTLPAPRLLPPLDAQLSADELRALATEQPAALGLARQQARFLCGLSSPAVSKARLMRHPLFGVLETYHFEDVLRWCEGL